MLAGQLASQTNNTNNKYQQQILHSPVAYNSTRVQLTDQNIVLEKVTRPSLTSFIKEYLQCKFQLRIMSENL